MKKIKKHKEIKKETIKKPEILAEEKISKTGWKIISIGILVLILGFFVLSKTDPEGKNLASILSPFLIIGGYIVIGIGIVFPGKKKSQS